jgi:hypothetical protein
MALTEFLIPRKPRNGCLEERTALIQPIGNSFTAAFAGMTVELASTYKETNRS